MDNILKIGLMPLLFLLSLQ